MGSQLGRVMEFDEIKNIRRRPGRVALCALTLWAAILTGTFLLLNAPPGLQAWTKRQAPAIASLRDHLHSLVYRETIF